MKPDADYPRMMFHRTKNPVTVYSRVEEQLLGREWSRIIGAALPREEKPPDPQPDKEPEGGPELPPEPEREKTAADSPAPRPKPKIQTPRGGAAHRAPAHKRKG